MSSDEDRSTIGGVRSADPPGERLLEAYVLASRAVLLASTAPQVLHLIANAVQGLRAPASSGARRDLDARMAAAGRVLGRLARPEEAPGKPLFLPELLHEVDETLHLQTTLTSVAVSFQTAEPLPAVRANAADVHHALLALVTNARESAAAGGTVSVMATHRGAASVITVEDDGPGFPGGQADEWLAPFRSTKKGHLGLGLTVAKHLIERNGGRLRVEARAGRPGACIVLELPAWSTRRAPSREA